MPKADNNPYAPPGSTSNASVGRELPAQDWNWPVVAVCLLFGGSGAIALASTAIVAEAAEFGERIVLVLCAVACAVIGSTPLLANVNVLPSTLRSASKLIVAVVTVLVLLFVLFALRSRG